MILKTCKYKNDVCICERVLLFYAVELYVCRDFKESNFASHRKECLLVVLAAVESDIQRLVHGLHNILLLMIA